LLYKPLQIVLWYIDALVMYSKQYLNDLEQLHAICLRNTTGVTNWAGTELLSLRSTWVHSFFSEIRVGQSVVLCVVFCRPLLVFLRFFILSICCQSYKNWKANYCKLSVSKQTKGHNPWIANIYISIPMHSRRIPVYIYVWQSMDKMVKSFAIKVTLYMAYTLIFVEM
jgi:hypothetical protein